MSVASVAPMGLYQYTVGGQYYVAVAGVPTSDSNTLQCANVLYVPPGHKYTKDGVNPPNWCKPGGVNEIRTFSSNEQFAAFSKYAQSVMIGTKVVSGTPAAQEAFAKMEKAAQQLRSVTDKELAKLADEKAQLHAAKQQHLLRLDALNGKEKENNAKIQENNAKKQAILEKNMQLQARLDEIRRKKLMAAQGAAGAPVAAAASS